EIPALAMLSASVTELRERAERLRAFVCGAGVMEEISIVDSEASVGGGAFPTARIPSIALAVGGNVTQLERQLRSGEPAVVSRVADGRLLLDVRTILPRDDAAFASALRTAFLAVHGRQ